MMASKDSILPLHVPFRGSRPYHRIRSDSRSHLSKIDFLLTRARVTNLGLVLLASFAALSFLFNLRFLFFSSQPHRTDPAGSYDHRPHSILETLDRHDSLLSLNHLIIVPGHAIWKGFSPEDVYNEEKWLLEPYQRGGGRIEAFVKHIQEGVSRTLMDEHALLVFSGGQTRPTSTTTEGESYLRLAVDSGLLPNDSLPFLRATTEDHALDSFQNLLFSIARFHEYTGHYPTKITVVGYEMKRRRFIELHRTAIRWPLSHFNYVGIDAEGEATSIAQEGEKKKGYIPYTRDTYGCHGVLQSKRRSRNPFMRYHSYYTSSPELGALFNWCPGSAEGGEKALFDGPLPWDGLT